MKFDSFYLEPPSDISIYVTGHIRKHLTANHPTIILANFVLLQTRIEKKLF